ncbi:MAG: hypothetical protein ACM3UU_05365 [Ignavibacteriales bacterium]
MKKDKYNLFDHFYYCTLVLVVVLVMIFMQCLSHIKVSGVNQNPVNTMTNQLP